MTWRRLAPILLSSVLLLLTLAQPKESGIDNRLSQLVLSLPIHLGGFMDRIATLATYPYLIGAAFLWAIIELTRRNWQRSLLILASLGAQILFYIIKELTQRARPVSEFVQAHGLHDYSFPSGHAAGSAAVFGMIALLSIEILPRIYHRIFIALLIALIVVIGVGRVYLQAHFPTDVIGGWLIGLITISILRPISIRYITKTETNHE